MASKLKVFPIKSHVGGLDVYSNATQVDDAASPDAINFYFKGLTAVVKRQGYIRLTTSAVTGSSPVPSTFSYITDSVREILYVANGSLYKYNGSGGSTLVTASCFSVGALVNAAQVGDRLYFADGASALQYYNGTSVVTTGIVSAPTTPSIVINYNDRLYCNSGSNKDRIYYGQPLTSTGASTNTGDFTVGNNSGFFLYGLGREVTTFSKIGTSGSSSLYIFLKDGIERATPAVVSSVTVHTNVTISNSIGCRAPRSVDNVENDIYFLDSTVYSLGEVGTFTSLRTRNVSARVQLLFEGMDQASVRKAAAIYYEKEQCYLLAISVSGTANDHVIGYSVPYKAWFYWDNISASSFLDFVDSSDVKHLYFGSADESLVFELFQGLNDDDEAYTFRYRTKEFDFKEFNIEKLYQNWNIQFGGVFGTTTVRVYVDGSLADSVMFTSGTSAITQDGWGTRPMGLFPMGLEGNFQTVTSSEQTLSNDWRWHELGGLNGTTIQLEYENANLNEGVEIKQASIGYIPLPYYKRAAERQV